MSFLFAAWYALGLAGEPGIVVVVGVNPHVSPPQVAGGRAREVDIAADLRPEGNAFLFPEGGGSSSRGS